MRGLSRAHGHVPPAPGDAGPCPRPSRLYLSPAPGPSCTGLPAAYPRVSPPPPPPRLSSPQIPWLVKNRVLSTTHSV